MHLHKHILQRSEGCPGRADIHKHGTKEVGSSQCLTCTFRGSCCSARLSRAQVPAFAGSFVRDRVGGGGGRDRLHWWVQESTSKPTAVASRRREGVCNLECPVGLSQREICAHFSEGNLDGPPKNNRGATWRFLI